MEIRLNKFLSRCGVASRREADRLLGEGRVTVNGQTVQDLGVKIDDKRDRVLVDGKTVKARPKLVYLALNKPAGYLVTRSDPFGRPTIWNLLPAFPGVNPVGRLDFASEGLLLLTNDGELSFRLTHPKFEILKTYVVRVRSEVTTADIGKLEKGIFFEGRKTAPAKVRSLEAHRGKSVLEIEIHEGRKREVRQMFERLGHRLEKLKRVSFAGLTLKHLPSGQWRHLTRDEVQKLRRLAKMADAQKSGTESG
jgi:23S rRNA pseudouridine2605 synthase